MQMEQPAYYTVEEYQKIQGRMLPKYALCKGLTNSFLIKCIRQALEETKYQKDDLPADLRERFSLAEYNFAIHQIHFPESKEKLVEARKRLVFEEFFLFILMLRRWKGKKEECKNEFSFSQNTYVEKLLASLPYELTKAQQRVYEQMKKELRSEHVMNRLIQGDVGSGKTILAVLALLMAAENGYQAAMMAPTEVLAKQHFESIENLTGNLNLPLTILLLTGSMTEKQKREAREKIASGEADIVIGTHALIQDKVEFAHLALVVTDEQHRFGVRQRETFSEKGNHMPHILVMSATPIPRTLAVILYGDLDISVVDELPAKRIPIKNCVVGTGYRDTAYRFIEKQVKSGHQAYVICPLVEESELAEGENVLDYAEVLRSKLSSDCTVGILHGRMKPAEKNEVMEQFAANQIQVLVSTTVVEVGVNVPNATVMMIENAEHFGLAQLHQLRGRVGRGDAQSYCIFLNTSGQEQSKRLETLQKSNDGFYIASEDLKLRGPGDLFGIRQSGLMEFKIGDVFTDAAILQKASEEAERLMAEDPELLKEEHHQLKKKIEEWMGEKKQLSL